MRSPRPFNVATAVTALVALGLSCGLPCSAAGDPARSCIQKATEAVSQLPRMQVKKSSTRPVTSEQLANWKGQSKPIMVDVDFVSPDESGTYSYICATSPSGQAFVRRVESP